MTVAPVHFIAREHPGLSIEDMARRRLDIDYPYWIGGATNWAAQTYLVLRQHREQVTLGARPKPGSINVAHVQTWRATERGGEYRVSIRADYRRLFDVDFEIVQNPSTVVAGRRQAYVPYWPLPGLRPRDPSRDRVAVAAYAGRLGRPNLAAAVDKPSLWPPGLEFKVVAPDQWHDMRGIDVLLAIRDFSRRSFDGKPASKLINAWHADIPFVGGYDSAFSTAGTPGVDYLRVSSGPELLDALRRLSEDAGLYRAIVEAGRIRRRDYTREKIAAIWLKTLGGPIEADWQAFNEAGGRRQSAASLGDRALGIASDAKAWLRRRAAGA